MVVVKLLKDTQRITAPFTSLSLRKEQVQYNYMRKDNMLMAARKRFRDLCVANGSLRFEQQLHVANNVGVGILSFLFLVLYFILYTTHFLALVCYTHLILILYSFNTHFVLHFNLFKNLE
jgi:hypothetical protein